MKESYSNKQQKIYSDYQDHSTEELLEMVNSNKYSQSVIEVVEDILHERKVIPINTRQKVREQVNIKMNSEERQKKVAKFMKQHENRTNSELDGIISNPFDYQLESVEAALIISEQRGRLTCNEKEKMLDSIQSEFIRIEGEREKGKKEQNESAQKDMLFGALWCVGGIVVTMVTYENASGGGTYIVAWGAIVFGGLQFLKGLFSSF